METVIEQQRRCHEERERLEDAMTQELMLKKGSLKEQINADHRVRFLLERYVEITGDDAFWGYVGVVTGLFC